MGSKNLISFNIDDIEQIRDAENNVEFAVTSGYPEIKVNDIDMTKDIDSGRIIEFAVNLLNEIPQIISGIDANISYNDDEWIFSFKRNLQDEDYIKCNVNGWYSNNNAFYPTKEFCLDVLYAIRDLDKLINENKIKDRFSFYNILEQVKHDAIDSIIENDIVPLEEIQKIFNIEG